MRAASGYPCLMSMSFTKMPPHTRIVIKIHKSSVSLFNSKIDSVASKLRPITFLFLHTKKELSVLARSIIDLLASPQVITRKEKEGNVSVS